MHTTTTPFYGPRIVAVAFVTLMGAFGLNLSGGQFFAPLTESFGWGLATLSSAAALNMIVWGVFQPVVGRLIDRFGPRPVIAASVALMGVAFLAASTLTTLWEFYLYYGVLTAIGFAGCGSMANSVLVARWYVRGRAKMLARSAMGMNIGQLVFLPLAGWLIVASGFRGAFLVFGILMLVVVLPLVLFVSHSSPDKLQQAPDGDELSAFTPPKSAALAQALRDSDFWMATIGFVTCGYSLYLVVMHLPRFAVDLGATAATGGRVLGLAAGASALSMWICGQLVGRVGKKKLLLGLYLIRMLALGFLACSSEIWQLYAFALVYGIASMPIIPLKTGLIGDMFGANAMGSILGMAWFLHQVLAAIAVFLGGWLRVETGSYAAAFWSATVLLLLGAIATAFVRKAGGPTVPPRVVRAG
ncbi:MFS transporter [Cephaloticoccus primus]|uniref:MFS transporter n=1 Tax=Cephaloticoccus primus TaxID=1548207 RepID=A0A139SH71_9BACT|nr:MFS transporter [Cephaloticoccus primus]KXU33907.1 MFS transporter [Cephaloticoccus primus]